ncbi:hypothetical protein [Massilia horti]|uniref:hypothetical protein n=1 Tax=Massilia horti TaxID=2562153 RepID=UPI00143157CB|nr:hypothetical protein [Massilia horti]
MSGVPKSQVSRLCKQIDERAQTILNRPIESEPGSASVSTSCQALAQAQASIVRCCRAVSVPRHPNNVL